MTIDDYEKVSAFCNSMPGTGIRGIDDSKEGIKKFLKRNPRTCFVADIDGSVAGVILSGHDGRQGFIYHTAVQSKNGKQGIGKALVSAVEDAMKKEGINRLVLAVFKKNKTGNDFWGKLGFLFREDISYRGKNFSGEKTGSVLM
jgi:ribosomal protein S18 acetylase RimI-like enzyme